MLILLAFVGLARRLLNTRQQQFGRSPLEAKTMYNRKFFQTSLGQAALVSIAAMAAFVALSSQIVVSAPVAAIAVSATAELA